LIAEKLWALKADELQIDTIETIKLSLQSLKNLFVKDELFKQEVESKIVITNDEISKGITRVNRILNTSIITSPDSVKIYNLFNTFQTGTHFDSELNDWRIPQKSVEVKYGSIEDEAVEDILYSLNFNEISKPVKYKNNWFIFKLVSEKQDISLDLTKDNVKNIVIKKIKDKKTQKLAITFLDKLLVGKTVTANRGLFDTVTGKLTEVLKTRSGKSESDSLVDIQLLDTDILDVLSMMSEVDLNDSFVTIGITTATVKQFLFYLIYQKIQFTSLKTDIVKQNINSAVKRFIEDEFIVREGYKRGFENMSSVKNDLQIWKNYYLSEFLKNSYSDSIEISEKEVEDYRQNKSNSLEAGLQINIVEILTDKLDDVENIMNQINEGKDFNYLASVFNKREWTKQSNGEWGLFDASSGGEIGRIAADLEIGQIHGPLKVPEGYSIFKLIDKRRHSIDDQKVTDNENIKSIRIKIKLSKMNKLINEKTILLTKKYSLSIDEKMLNSLETSELNMFTYRFIGFGGKIAAFPITTPMYEWYKQKKETP